MNSGSLAGINIKTPHVYRNDLRKLPSETQGKQSKPFEAQSKGDAAPAIVNVDGTGNDAGS